MQNKTISDVADENSRRYPLGKLNDPPKYFVVMLGIATHLIVRYTLNCVHIKKNLTYLVNLDITIDKENL